MSCYKSYKSCFICKKENLTRVITLGEQYLQSRFPRKDEYVPKAPCNLVLCEDCKLVQLEDVVDKNELYEHSYGYMSSISNTMRTHLEKYNMEIREKITLNENDWVLDIGSNDATFLKYYPNNLNKLGVDPTGKQFRNFYENINLIPTYFTYDNVRNVFKDQKFKVITSICMFYDLEDPVQFAKDISKLLDDDGIWSFEQSYIVKMLKTNSFDTICHEHLEYYNIKNIIYILNEADLKLLDISFNESNGGSFRIYASKKDSKLIDNEEFIQKCIKDEETYNLDKIETYLNFQKGFDNEVKKLKLLIDTVNQNNQKMFIYGASTKGNTLLQYLNLNSSQVPYAVERNLDKVGKYTPGTNIEIISEEKMRENPPEYLLVLPWHFKEEIIQREKKFLDNGGKLVFPLPNFEIISKKEKILITGIEGQIGQYVQENFKDHEIFGITRQIQNLENGLKFEFNINNLELLERTILTINPSKIIHLASMTSSEYCLKHPVECIQNNGLVASKICEVIHNNNLKCKFFNASSSEIFKGHHQYKIQVNDNNYKPRHPYSFAKVLSHQVVDWYRNTFNLPFSNGVIFTTESKLRKSCFLVKKLLNHIKDVKMNEKNVLELGNLDSKRVFCHANDVAKAIKIILSQDKGDNYNICGNNILSIKNLILNLYKINDIELEENSNTFMFNNEVLIRFNTPSLISQRPDIDTNTLITGDNSNLVDLGWKIDDDNFFQNLIH
jgi:GDP-mannose 4,6-dehydratase